MESSLREMRGLELDQNLHSMATTLQVMTYPVLVSLWHISLPLPGMFQQAGTIRHVSSMMQDLL